MDSPRKRVPVDDYLARLNAELYPMPPAERLDLLQELRQHLEGLAAAHRELGAPQEAAALAAMRQFGDPVKIGQRLIREWQWAALRRIGDIRRWPLWVRQGVGGAASGLLIALGVAGYWQYGHESTPLLEGLMRGGILMSAAGQGLLGLGAVVNYVNHMHCVNQARRRE